jgi:hypothetical protein
MPPKSNEEKKKERQDRLFYVFFILFIVFGCCASVFSRLIEKPYDIHVPSHHPHPEFNYSLYIFIISGSLAIVFFALFFANLDNKI